VGGCARCPSPPPCARFPPNRTVSASLFFLIRILGSTCSHSSAALVAVRVRPSGAMDPRIRARILLCASYFSINSERTSLRNDNLIYFLPAEDNDGITKWNEVTRTNGSPANLRDSGSSPPLVPPRPPSHPRGGFLRPRVDSVRRRATHLIA